MQFEGLEFSDRLELSFEDYNVAFLVADQVPGGREDDDIIDPNVALWAARALPEFDLVSQFLDVEDSKAFHNVTGQNLIIDGLDHVK